MPRVIQRELRRQVLEDRGLVKVHKLGFVPVPTSKIARKTRLMWVVEEAAQAEVEAVLQVAGPRPLSRLIRQRYGVKVAASTLCRWRQRIP